MKDLIYQIFGDFMNSSRESNQWYEIHVYLDFEKIISSFSYVWL